jgi:hypothetical protein
MVKPSHKYIYVYQTINKINGKSYVGLHSTNNLNDGYIGCGIFSQAHAKSTSVFHNAVRKYGYASFNRHILSFYDTYQEAIDEERFIVDEKWVKRKDTYNMALGGAGYMFANLSADEVSDKYRGAKNHRFGKKPTNCKPVIQQSITGAFIKRHISATDAAMELGIIGSNISACCSGRYSQSGGFVFVYESYTAEERIKFDENKSKRHRTYKSDGSWEMSDATKNKLKGRPSAMKGRVVSMETRGKQSVARIGKKLKPCSEERKRKIGEANRAIHLMKQKQIISIGNGR